MIEINKSDSRKVRFGYGDRGFFCPTCLCAVPNASGKCEHCEQVLIAASEFNDAKKADEE